MTSPTKKVLFLCCLLVIPLVNAAEVVSRVDNATIILHNTSTIRNITNESVWAWYGRRAERFDESDDRFGLRLQVLGEQDSTAVTLLGTASRLFESYDLYYCTNTPVDGLAGRLYLGADLDCPAGWHYYHLQNLRDGDTVLLSHPPPDRAGRSDTRFFVGGKGWHYGAASSSGLPVCEGMSAAISLNQTNGTITFLTLVGGKGDPFSGDPGCSIDWLRWQYTNLTGQWQNVPINDDGNGLNCNGSSCFEANPPLSTWKYRNLSCDISRNVSLRIRMQYDTFSNPNLRTNSVTKNLECFDGNVPILAGVGAWWVYALPLVLMLSAYLVVARKRGEEGGEE